MNPFTQTFNSYVFPIPMYLSAEKLTNRIVILKVMANEIKLALAWSVVPLPSTRWCIFLLKF